MSGEHKLTAAELEKLTIDTADWPSIRTVDPSWFASENLHITCGKGSVCISLKDGSITFQNCQPPEAAQEFWRAVTNTFPSVVEGIRIHAK